MENNTVNEGKTTAIISYITVIGTIIALIMNSSKKNSFAAFHIRQMIGLCILQIINGVLRSYTGVMISSIIGIALLILWVIGFLGAVQGEEKSVPLLGDSFQNWFKGI